ncbi:DUF6220 domain-containing protein [Rhizobiaceae sp. 2RAB30]
MTDRRPTNRNRPRPPVPAGIVGQFLLAGLSLFVDAEIWGLHGILGTALVLAIGVIAIAPYTRSDIRPLRHWSTVLGFLYIVQIAFIATAGSYGSGLLRALHVFNAGLLLVAAAVIVAKIERSHRG